MEIMAYLDPGTGSIVIQAILGGVLAVGVALRAYRQKIANFFGKNKKTTIENSKASESTKKSE